MNIYQYSNEYSAQRACDTINAQNPNTHWAVAYDYDEENDKDIYTIFPMSPELIKLLDDCE